MQHFQQDWQAALANAITNPQELCDILGLDAAEFQRVLSNSPQFPLRVPRCFASRIEKGNWRDPLLLQVLPFTQELETSPDFCEDPLREKQTNPIPGLLHKYHGRVLLIAAAGCAIHCRYCFRRHFPYADNTPGTSGWQPALNYIAGDPTIMEVIFSGGDPLILKDAVLSQLITQIAAIPQVKILRFHTRLPIVLPQRITPALIELLTASRLQTVIVVHCNHPNEIDDHVRHVLFELRKTGVTLLNQFVLLKGINDNADVLVQLSQQLFSVGVLPYYLHLLDPVQGAAHFAVSAAEGRRLIQQMTDRLPGYLVPKLVCETAGQPAKVSL
jgi:L-lysine 2,3-aminomutase